MAEVRAAVTVEITPALQQRIDRYKAKRAALEQMRTLALETREESERLDRELEDEERFVAQMRTELFDELAVVARIDDPKTSEG